VPRASIVILAGTLPQFHIPTEAVATILGIDAIMDMARTSVNVIGNCLATCVMARWEGEFNVSFSCDPKSSEGSALPDTLPSADSGSRLN
jgi:proton glutamate symport protein